MDAQALVTRAFQIADQAMIELLLSHGMPMDGSVCEASGGAVALCDESSEEVRTLAESDPAIVEAFEWLQLRGRAELIEGTDGEFIYLKAEPK
jgi:hypothetical protein